MQLSLRQEGTKFNKSEVLILFHFIYVFFKENLFNTGKDKIFCDEPIPVVQYRVQVQYLFYRYSPIQSTSTGKHPCNLQCQVRAWPRLLHQSGSRKAGHAPLLDFDWLEDQFQILLQHYRSEGDFSNWKEISL